MDPLDALARWIDAHHRRAGRVPARDRARALGHAARRQRARRGKGRRRCSTALGFDVERHPVPRGVPARLRHAERHQPDRAPSLRRRRADDRAQCARRRRAAGRRLDPAAVRRRRSRRAACTGAASRFRSRTSRPTRTRSRRCGRCAKRGARLDGTVELHFTYDEEFGGLAGPGFLLERKLTKPDYAIAASFSYAVVTAHNGCLQFEVTVHGKSGHGAMPETGRDAFRAGTRDPERHLRRGGCARRRSKSQRRGHRPSDDDRRPASTAASTPTSCPIA